MSKLSKAGLLVQLLIEKEAGVRKGLMAVPRIIQRGFSTMGEQAAKELGGKGPLAFAAKHGLKAAPAAAAGYGAYRVAEPIASPYMKSKYRQFESAQQQSAPYYNYSTGRYE